MARCFVMQPFDGGVFDKRYDDVLEPAIRAAGLEPYRVDRDPHVSIPIDDIETGIRNADVCLAEITHDNPNVWFELGFAIACDKEVVLVCSSERATRFPFDIQHRTIVRYAPESPRDFEQLQQAVTDRLKAAVTKEKQLKRFATESPVLKSGDLSPQEMVALVVVMENSLDEASPPSAYGIRNDMGKAGYTDIAAVLSLKTLMKKGLIQPVEGSNYNGEDYTGYLATEQGEQWLIDNQDKLVLQKRPSPKVDSRVDEDLPF
jgi:nucleoside 2-deoxyribosyltransferase